MVKKQQKSRNWGILIFLIIIIVGGIFLFRWMIESNATKYDYEGRNGVYHIEKEKIGLVDFYHLYVDFGGGTYSYPFRIHPEDLEDVYVELGLDQKLNRPGGTKILYVTSDPDIGNMTNNDVIIAASVFEQVLGKGGAGLYRLNISNTYTEYVRNELSVITCANVTDRVAVIYMKLGDESKIYSEGDCIIIQGRGGNGLIRAGEKFGYYLLGVF